MSKMQSLDLVKTNYLAAADKLVAAAKGNDDKVMQEAFASFADVIQQNVMAEAEKYRDEMVHEADSAVLMSRGVRQLTSKEQKFYESWISAAKSDNPKQALASVDVVLPKTTIDDVFEDLVTAHPLLDAIDFQNVGAITEWLLNTNETQLASWSPLCADIVQELSSGFKVIQLALNKLSAFIPVCKAMLDLGPAWLDRYVRAVLQEALYLGLEDGVINGRGQTANIHEPIGMKKDMLGAVDPATGYPDKEPIPVTSLDPVSYGSLIANIAKTEIGNPRAVTNLILIVNPVDYFSKVFPATTVRAADGTYNHNILPFPTTIIQSTRMTAGQAIIGLGKRYFNGIGTGKSGKIEYADQTRFLEDERLYLVKLYGHGQPKDNNAFALLDISGLQPATLRVTVESGEIPNP